MCVPPCNLWNHQCSQKFGINIMPMEAPPTVFNINMVIICSGRTILFYGSRSTQYKTLINNRTFKEKISIPLHVSPTNMTYNARTYTWGIHACVHAGWLSCLFRWEHVKLDLKLQIPYCKLYSKNLICYSTCNEILTVDLCETARTHARARARARTRTHTPYTGSNMSLPLKKWNGICWKHFIAKFNQDLYYIRPVQILYTEVQTASKVNMLTGNDSPHKNESSMWDVAEDRLYVYARTSQPFVTGSYRNGFE